MAIVVTNKNDELRKAYSIARAKGDQAEADRLSSQIQANPLPGFNASNAATYRPNTTPQPTQPQPVQPQPSSTPTTSSNPQDVYAALRQIQESQNKQRMQDREVYRNNQQANIQNIFSNQLNSQAGQVRNAIAQAKLTLEQKRRTLGNQYQEGVNRLNLGLQEKLPAYQEGRNQVDVERAQAIARARESMANAGLAVSGDNMEGTSRINAEALKAIAANRQAEEFLKRDVGNQVGALDRERLTNETNIQENLAELARTEPERLLQLQQAIDAQKAQAQLDLESRLDTRDFNLDKFDFDKQQSLFNNLKAIAELKNAEIHDKALMTGYYDPYNVDGIVVPKDSPLRQYGNMEGGYQARLNYLQQNDPNSPEIPQILALRKEKIYSDPVLMKEYGNTLYKGFPTMDRQKMEYDMDPNNPINKGRNLANQEAETRLKYLPEELGKKNVVA